MRVIACLLAAAGSAIALLMISAPAAMVLTLPIVVGQVLVRSTGGFPETGPASFDAERVERTVARIVVASMLVAAVYVLLG